MAEETAAGYLDGRLEALREHALSLIAAAPGLPDAFAQAYDQLAREWAVRGQGYIFALISVFVLLGFAVEAAYRRVVRLEDAAERLRAIGLRFVREVGALGMFSLGSVAAFLSFSWPPRTRQAVVAALAALVLVRLVLMVSKALFAPRDARLRIVPVDDADAAQRHQRVGLFAGWLGFGWVLTVWLALLGMDLPSRQIVAYVLGLGLLAIALEAVWRRSRALAIGVVVIWLLWVLQARGLFWLALVAVLLPPLLRQIQAAADHLLEGVPAAVVGRGLRALAIVGAAALLVHAFSVNVDAVAVGDTMWMRLLRGVVQALAVVLIADVIWLVAAALIDQRLAADPDNNRLRTLLPIMRGTVAAVLLVVTLLMVLSALGVEVAPLLASAGVVGIAIGFGAQQLVRDLFAKYSYLLDDAFRVGEYIESGSYKGTVEHLGGRTVRLRHHRGPIFTIPYGQLGAVKNSSRDWVIDKMTIGVAYGTDLDKAKKLIKKIGQELAQNEEFAPHILEPLKMQGVEQFADYAIQLRIKMKTRPNQQFTIRRRAYAMINKAFAENGIHFAHPTVQVAGGGETALAAAALRQSLELKKAP